MNKEYRYLKEEELKRLIEQVEKDEMLSAPAYLKQEILSRAKGLETQAQILPEKEKLSQKAVRTENEAIRIEKEAVRTEKETVRTEKETVRTEKEAACRKISPGMQLFIYSAKIVAAAAAAMFCLTLLPVGMNRGGMWTDLSEREERIEQDMARYREQNTAETDPEQGKRKDIAVIMNEKTDELCWKLHQFSDLLIMEERDYD